MHQPIHLAADVRRALDRGAPVVALESTLICHGLPRPRNLEAARLIEQAVREEGATPATIALLDGVAHVGLDDDDLIRIASSSAIEKASIRDLARILATGGSGATTVASTIFLAGRAGIRVMATGGLGGVHPGGERSLDMSADLDALARAPVAVICAGVKSILDQGRTLERLETLGVPVIGLGVDRLPGFYAASSPHPVPRCADCGEAAAIVDAQADLGWPTGLVFCQPPPAAHAFSEREAEALGARAIAAARAAGALGKDETPFALSWIARETEGRSVALNEALVIENARAAAQIAAWRNHA